MKRVNNIFDRIISVENLTEADRMARRGKKSSYGVTVHDHNKKKNVLNLHDMKIYSSIPIPEIFQWKEGQWLVSINHRDNGVQHEGEEGRRYEADFTVSIGIDSESIAQAFERHFSDPEHDRKVIDTIEVEGKPAIQVIKTYPDGLPKIVSADVILDPYFVKESEQIKSLTNDADANIRKLAGNIRNYIADLTDGVRTSATDAEVEQLIADGNIIITVQ